MLLALPTELIHLILRSCDTSAFLQAAFCNRTLFKIASSSRDLIIHQLSQTPGHAENCRSSSVAELWELLKRRAYQELWGAEFHSEQKLIEFHGKVIDARASTLDAPGTHRDARKQAVLAFKGHGTVYLCKILDGALTLDRRLESPGKRFGAVEVLHTAVGSYGIYVLHRLRPCVDQDLDTNHPFVKHALQTNSNGSIFLACHRLDSATNKVHLYGFQEQKDYDPVALAVYDGKFAISWQHRSLSDDHQVVLYASKDARADNDRYDDGNHENDRQIDCISYDSIVLTEVNENGPSDGAIEGKGPTVKLAFNDRGLQLLHYYRARTLYGAFQRLYMHPQEDHPQAKVRGNACTVPFSASLSLQFSISIPFFGTHEADAESQGLFCHWKYLALGIATHRVENWTVACLLRSEAYCRSHHCGHVLNLDRGRRYDDWTVMAQLGGFHEPDTSHGSLVASSMLGTRIAMASWKTVSIWALHPQELIDDEGHEFYPGSWRNPDNLMELQPVVIQLDAVCSQLRFTDSEDRLVAITDRGFLTIDLRPDGRGIQAVERLADWFADEEP